MEKTVQFVLDKTTPGALRYQEVDDKGNPRKRDVEGAVINTLYIRKSSMKGEPKKLTVIVKIAE